MAAAILTTEDLHNFKSELFKELKQLFSTTQTPPPIQWLKSYQVVRLLSISRSTLNTLVQNGTLQPTLLGGNLFFNQTDINALMQKNKVRKK